MAVRDALVVIGGRVQRLPSGDTLNVGPQLPLTTSGAVVDVVSTTTKTALVSFTIPSNTLGTSNAIDIDIVGDYLNNSGSTSTLTFEVAYGGTVMYADVTTAQTANAARHPMHLSLVLAAANSASAQVLGGDVGMNKPGAATTGLGDIAALITTATGFAGQILGSATVDSTADRTFVVSVTHSVANAATSCRCLYVSAVIRGKGVKGDTGVAGPAGFVGVNDQTGTSYTISSPDNGKDVRCTNAAAVALNIDTQANAPMPAGFACMFSQGGAGIVTASALAGVTLRAPNGAATTAQYDARGLEYLGGNEWRCW